MNRLMLLGFLLATATAHAFGTLRLGEPTVEDNKITVPVILGGELSDGVSAMDFRFRYNPDAVQPVSFEPGSTAADAGKRVLSNQYAPGEYSVVMMGFNQTACGPGEAVQIVLQRLHGEDGNWSLDLSNPTMSSVDGSLIDSRILPGRDRAEEPEQEDAGRRLPGTPDTGSDGYAHGAPAAGLFPAGHGDETERPREPTKPGESAVGDDLTGQQMADKLLESLESAFEVRAGIDLPTDQPPDSGGLMADATVEPAGAQDEDQASLIGAGLVAEAPVFHDTTVEPQASAIEADMPQPVRENGRYAFYTVAFLVSVALMAALYTRRPRLTK